MIIYFVEEIDFFSCLLYNTASYDTFLFWFSLYNSDSRSKIVELNNFDATICPRLILSRFSLVKKASNILPYTHFPRGMRSKCHHMYLSWLLICNFCCDFWVINLEFSQRSFNYLWIYITRTVSQRLQLTRLLAAFFKLGDFSLNSLWKFDTVSIISINIEPLCCSRLGGNRDGI